MPGPYTHITHVRLLTQGRSLNKMKLPQPAEIALLDYPRFCRMGAISPDYPYLQLAIGSAAAEHLANAMHHKYGTLTRHNILHIGVQHLRTLANSAKSKCFSWFLGYASHIVADVTCHPVTNMLVGDYEADNQRAHRRSELHQDVYIYKTRLNADPHNAEEIKKVIGACTDHADRDKIDQDIEKFWRYLLHETFPEICSTFSVDINAWHKSAQVFLDDIAEELSFFPCRHINNIIDNLAIAYPSFSDVDMDAYINKLGTPKGVKSYDAIFDYTQRKITKVWQLLSNGVFNGDDNYKRKVGIWNLDTGQEVSTRKIMWGKGI